MRQKTIFEQVFRGLNRYKHNRFYKIQSMYGFPQDRYGDKNRHVANMYAELDKDTEVIRKLLEVLIKLDIL